MKLADMKNLSTLIRYQQPRQEEYLRGTQHRRVSFRGESLAAEETGR